MAASTVVYRGGFVGENAVYNNMLSEYVAQANSAYFASVNPLDNCGCFLVSSNDKLIRLCCIAFHLGRGWNNRLPSSKLSRTSSCDCYGRKQHRPFSIQQLFVSAECISSLQHNCRQCRSPRTPTVAADAAQLSRFQSSKCNNISLKLTTAAAAASGTCPTV
eukprot:GHRR01026500.1.p1 GENE.GHRR01026500.1~~GHRR01026500.1.p1  ORF type:complete len:162 (+),score=25.57 GHRR01026500.1:99-584(+)